MSLPLTDTQIAELVEAARVQLCDVYDCPSCISGKHKRWGSGLVGIPVPAVPCEHCTGGWLAEYNTMDPKPRRVKCTRCTNGQVLDPRWVEAATDTCTTNGCNDGHLCVQTEPDSYEEVGRCPDCFEGSPYHPLAIECDHENARTIVSTDGDDWRCECGADDGGAPSNGRRVGRLAITTLAPYDENGHDCPDTPHVCKNERWSHTGYLWHRWLDEPEGDTERAIRIVGTPVPGDWVAVLKVRT